MNRRPTDYEGSRLLRKGLNREEFERHSPRPSWLFVVGFGAVALRLRDGWPDRATNPIASARRAVEGWVNPSWMCDCATSEHGVFTCTGLVATG